MRLKDINKVCVPEGGSAFSGLRLWYCHGADQIEILNVCLSIFTMNYKAHRDASPLAQHHLRKMLNLLL
jgi:hypothetical protein